MLKDAAYPFKTSAKGEWQTRTSPLTQRASLFSNQVGAGLEVTLPPAFTLKLLLLKHDWSGFCRIQYGHESREIDLYSSVPGGEIYELPIPDSTVAVALELLAAKNPASHSSEVWFLGLKIEGKLCTVERGTPISKTCRIVKGEWGTFITLRTDTGVAEELAAEGVWARNDIPIFRKAIQPGDNVLDIGANFGHHTVVFSQLTGPTGHVIGFEPQSVMFQLLNANLAVNDIQNATVLQCAIGRAPGTMTMFPIDYREHLNFGSFGIDTNASVGSSIEPGERVDVARLDDVLESIVLTRAGIDFVKIDVQAFELFVLQGALESLRLYKPILFLEIAPLWMQRANYHFGDIYALLHSLGYNILHPSMDESNLHEIPEWDGHQNIEWDILAVHPDNPRSVLSRRRVSRHSVVPAL
jgi:FkbM family methyltransferase